MFDFAANRELGENMTDDELRAMIDEFDKDGDGESECIMIKSSSDTITYFVKITIFTFLIFL